MAGRLIVVHGAGSTADFARRALASACASVDEVVAVDDRTGDVDLIIEHVDAHLAGHEPGETLLAGVSLGAHAIAIGAATRHWAPSGLLLCLPAWTGPPGEVSTVTAATAARVRLEGMRSVLDGLAPHDWVCEELARAWPAYGDGLLADALERAAASRGPTIGELRRIRVPAGVVALADDPLHPAEVAATWARSLRCARLRTVSRNAPAADRSVIGRAALEALAEARFSEPQ